MKKSPNTESDEEDLALEQSMYNSSHHHQSYIRNDIKDSRDSGIGIRFGNTQLFTYGSDHIFLPQCLGSMRFGQFLFGFHAQRDWNIQQGAWGMNYMSLSTDTSSLIASAGMDKGSRRH
jgi:hypothetical protein